MDVLASIINDQLVDEETRISISEDPKDGIILVDISLRGEDVPPLLSKPC